MLVQLAELTFTTTRFVYIQDLGDTDINMAFCYCGTGICWHARAEASDGAVI